ncbi:MAG: hypothetical protein QF464_18190 [Myxococcota bacterium]|nr:hypothetical protein [Myxococcota bacterium]
MNRHLTSLALIALVSAGCTTSSDDGVQVVTSDAGVALTLRFLTEEEASCNMASPLSHLSTDGVTEVLTITLDGIIRAFDPDTGEERWRHAIASPEGESVILLSTPAIIDDLMLVTWSFAVTGTGLPDQGKWPKTSHHVQGFDLDTRAWHPDFPRVSLTASETAWDGADVTLTPSKQKIRSRVAYLPDGEGDGLAYVSMGDGSGGHPYHGWLFELDMDAWRSAGAEAAISGVMLTTRDTDCAYDNEEWLFSEVCGGGIWSPAGPVETTAATRS